MILYYWHASPAINYDKLFVVFFLKIFPVPTSFSFSFSFGPDHSSREKNKSLTAILKILRIFCFSRVAIFIMRD